MKIYLDSIGCKLNQSEIELYARQFRSAGHTLVASPHGIFGVHSLREVSEYNKFWAIGSGSEYALGAMFAVHDIYDTAEEIAAACVKAGAEFNNASSMPMTSYVTDLVTLKSVNG